MDALKEEAKALQADNHEWRTRFYGERKSLEEVRLSDVSRQHRGSNVSIDSHCFPGTLSSARQEACGVEETRGKSPQGQEGRREAGDKVQVHVWLFELQCERGRASE